MQVHEVTLQGGVRLQVEEAGSGPAVLLMHAGVSERHMWDPQWAWLQERYRVLRWDWRGFGETPHVPGPFSYAADVVTIMDQLGIDRATLVGCSFGGSVAIKVAMEHPERVARLVLVGSGLPGFEGENPPQVLRMFEEVDEALARDDAPRALSLMEQLWLIGPRRTAADVDQAYLSRANELLQAADRPDNGAVSQDRGWSALGGFGQIKVPVLVVVGEEDLPEIMACAREMARLLPPAEVRTIAGAAHLPNLERPQAFDEVLRPWFAETDRAAH